MIIKTDSRIFTLQLIVANVFAVLVGLAAFFLAGAFLIPFLAALAVLNGFWYFMVYIRKRVVALELDSIQLTISHNKGNETLQIPLASLKLEVAEGTDHNANKADFFSIYQNDELLHQFKPASLGFDKGALTKLIVEVEKLKPESEKG